MDTLRRQCGRKKTFTIDECYDRYGNLSEIISSSLSDKSSSSCIGDEQTYTGNHSLMQLFLEQKNNPDHVITEFTATYTDQNADTLDEFSSLLQSSSESVEELSKIHVFSPRCCEYKDIQSVPDVIPTLQTASVKKQKNKNIIKKLCNMFRFPI